MAEHLNAPGVASNQALKLTRLSGCLLGGLGFGEDRAMQRPCPSSAVQLSAGVRPRSFGSQEHES